MSKIINKWEMNFIAVPASNITAKRFINAIESELISFKLSEEAVEIPEHNELYHSNSMAFLKNQQVN